MKSLIFHNASRIREPHERQEHLILGFQASTWFTALLASLILVSLPARTILAQQPTDNNTAFVTLSVTDKYGRYVSGLRREHFSVFEKKEPLDITFFSQDDKPSSVGVILDLSGSMAGKSQAIAKAVNLFIQESNKLNDYMIVGFNKKAQLICDWTSSQDDILKALSGVFKYNPKGQTALYDAIYLSVKRMSSSPHSKHVLLIVSDGNDDASEISLKQIRRMLRESDVMVYVLGLIDPESSLGNVGMDNLKDLASASGGLALFPRAQIEMDDACRQFAEELRHQYVIGISPSRTVTKDKWHRIDIKLTLPKADFAKFPNVYVRSREGYYVP